MAITLTKPDVGSTNWGVGVNNNWQILMDALNGTGSQTLGPLRINTTTQYTGLLLENATHSIASIVGYASGNEEGGLQLFNGADVKVQLLANGSSYFIGGSVGIGTTSPGQTLHVNGAIRASNLAGGGALTADAAGNIVLSPSDGNLKEDIELLDDSESLEKILALKGVTYEWINKSRFGDGREIGLVAQDVQAILPELVTCGEEYLSINYGKLAVILVGALKEQQRLLTTLKAKIDSLSNCD